MDVHLRESGRERHALCGVELRCPKPHPMDGFIRFNEEYCELLASWDLHVDGMNPVARTNVAPLYNPPVETTMHGFSYTTPSHEETGRTFVIAGAAVRAPLEMVGIQDCLTKSYGSNNSKNLVKAVIDGLDKLRSRETVEKLRGLELERTAVEQAIERGEAFLGSPKKTDEPEPVGATP